MKSLRNIYIGAALVMMAVSSISCQNEIDELIGCSENERDQINGAALTFIDDTLSTKTQWTGQTIHWSEGDKIRVGYTLNGAWSDALFDSEALTESAQRAQFDVQTDLEGTESGALNFYGVYPSSAVSSDFSDAPTVAVTIPSEQVVSGTSYDPAADLMVAESMTEYGSVPSSSVPLLWTRLTAHADITLSGLPQSSVGAVRIVRLTADSEVCMAGKFMVDIRSGEFQVSEPSNVVTIDVSALDFDASGNLNVWASFMPCSMKNLTVEVETDKVRYVRNISECNLEFEGNMRNVLEIDMSSAQKYTLADDNEIDTTVFELLNLDYPGLETVKAEYQAGRYGAAAAALVDYYRSRSVVHPEIDLSVKRLYSEEARIADQALEHRFCVRKGKWYESMYVDENGTNRYNYYDFDDDNGKINWYFVIPTIGQEDYQLHWHEFFKYLAWATVEKSDDRYFDCWKEVYSDWLKNFPGPTGTNLWASFYNKAWHQLSTSSRITNQLADFPYFITSNAFTGSWMSEYLAAFHKLVEFDCSHTYHDLTSNVTFQQYTARASAGILMPEFKNARTWLDNVAPLISNQFSVQFLEDGTHSEMTPKYHMGVLDSFRTIYNIANANNCLDSFTADYVEKMRAAAVFLANYVYPDYTWETFNDTNYQTENVMRKTIAKYAEFFPDENILVYLGTDRTKGTEPVGSLITYKDGGYYIFRNNWRRDGMMLILKNNYDPNNEPHVHSDNGTFGLFNNGRNFLPDPGIYTYGGTDALDAKREQYLATANHNTLTKNLETIATGYSLGQCLLSRTSPEEDLVVTQNPSYADLTHRRAVYMLDKKYFVIVDEAFGIASGEDINLSFHLCEGDVVADDNSESCSYGVHTVFDDGNDMLFRTFSETKDGFTGEIGTSYWSQYENSESARPYYRVTADKVTSDDVVRFITVICPGRSADISASFDAPFSSKGSSVKVTLNGKEYYLSYSL